MADRAVVLGAGGPAATAWALGVAAGLCDGGVDIRDAEMFVGTSAGGRVAVSLASGADLNRVFHHLLEPAAQSDAFAQTAVHIHGDSPSPDAIKAWREQLFATRQGGGDTAAVLRRIGAWAMQMPATPDPRDMRDVRDSVRAELAWPVPRVLAVACEAETGMRRAFERASDVPLAKALAATSAVPGLRPAIEIAGRHYFDGGCYSVDNADLAAGSARVLIIALRTGAKPMSLVPLQASVDALHAAGSQVECLLPDETVEAILESAGGNVLDPKVGPPIARAARQLGQRAALKLGAFWNG